MLTIGDFARHGRVSVRMLRHYDAIGLLSPARTDPFTGYRWYEAAQLARLNRIVAFKDLGFTLQQVATLLDEQVSAEELHGMLRLRRAELAERAAADARRLAGVEARLRTIEREGRMPTDEVVIKTVPAVRVAELTGVAAKDTNEDIAAVIEPLYEQLFERLEAAGVTPREPAIAYYEPAPDSDEGLVVHAAVPVSAEPGDARGFAIVDLPEIEAATVVHHGPMAGVLSTYQAIAQWVETHNYRSTGMSREVYLVATPDDDQSGWVTELQEPVVPR
ncbi:MerR family transcriptional regulator [Streptomyces sp. B1866]|uniref:MerR family transcriptional regulator n=1 Tax=Streptomyces sp. B1866 TaxID=3075431 RepID=UPI00288EB092|nr:MerR family transcriptional regulator [Streptomyces sp. B1866]MDT3398626.1 MerR family transcriptional regulator [Streptomyces sp. B1866]